MDYHKILHLHQHHKSAAETADKDMLKSTPINIKCSQVTPIIRYHELKQIPHQPNLDVIP